MPSFRLLFFYLSRIFYSRRYGLLGKQLSQKVLLVFVCLRCFSVVIFALNKIKIKCKV